MGTAGATRGCASARTGESTSTTCTNGPGTSSTRGPPTGRRRRTRGYTGRITNRPRTSMRLLHDCGCWLLILNGLALTAAAGELRQTLPRVFTISPQGVPGHTGYRPTPRLASIWRDRSLTPTKSVVRSGGRHLRGRSKSGSALAFSSPPPSPHSQALQPGRVTAASNAAVPHQRPNRRAMRRIVLRRMADAIP